MIENALKAAIFDLLKYPQYDRVLAMHILPARLPNGRIVTPFEGDRGWPDLVLAGPHGLILRELKQAGRYPTQDQRRWLTTLTQAGADAGVWRPAQLQDGTVLRELGGIR